MNSRVFTTINGWTKAKMRAVIEARPLTASALDSSGRCVYLAPDGNKCAVGMFLPEGHPGVKTRLSAQGLLNNYKEGLFPLNGSGMDALQLSHDLESPDAITSCRTYKGDAKAAMLNFIDTRVIDE